jgi:hypothetical protein
LRAGGSPAALMITPVLLLVQAVRSGLWWQAAWLVAAVAGAVVAGYAIPRVRSIPRRTLLTWLTIPSAVGLILMTVAILPAVFQTVRPLTALLVGAQSLLLFLPVVFVIEEVTFRGALDSHLHHDGESKQWPSAQYVSAL